MAIVQEMISAFAARGITASWESTGGGCYAVCINFGEQYRSEESFFSSLEIMITTQEGPLSWDDVNRDDEIPGFYAALYVYGEDWERVTDVGFTLYESRSGLITARERDEMLADGLAPDEIPATADLNAEMSALVEAVTWYAFTVAHAQKSGRAAESADFPQPEVVRVKRKNGIAGQFQMTADVQYGETTPQPVTFVGSTYGGPVVMVDGNGVQHFVTNPGRFGEFSTDAEEWVYRYFGQLN